jgi:uncharacterized protein YcnI
VSSCHDRKLITMSHTFLHRVVAGTAAGVLLAVAVPLAASAHVTVNPDTAEPGSYATVQFRVPNESDTATTTRVEVALPTDTPFLYVAYEPVPGWTISVTESTLPEPVEVEGSEITEAPTSIVFDADPGSGIAPGQFQNLAVVLGPVPDVGRVVLPAVQTYDDGTVAEWTASPEQMADDDSLEPAPVLYVTEPPPADEHGGTHSDDDAADATTTAGAEETATAAADQPGSGLAVGLSIAALVLAAGAAVLAALGFARTRNRS